MKITVELDKEVVQDYLDHYNEVNDTEHTLTKKVQTSMSKSFAEEMACEFQMRTDDLDGFEAENYFDL